MIESLRSMLDVSGTMLITLYARARESMSPNPIIQDPKAVEMMEVIRRELEGSDKPLHRKILNGDYNSKLAVCMSLRSRRFDRYARDFMALHPDGTVINFGCGLDTRFDRIDNGRIRWLDIDLPAVIELRRLFMKETPRRQFIACSILDPSWIACAGNGGPYLFLAEGLLMYLQEREVKDLLSMIHANFEGAELVCEVPNRYWVDRMKGTYMRRKFESRLGMSGGAVFSFGVPHSHYFEEWSEDYRFIDEWTYFDDGERKLGWMNLFAGVKSLRKVQWTVHYRI